MLIIIQGKNNNNTTTFMGTQIYERGGRLKVKSILCFMETTHGQLHVDE